MNGFRQSRDERAHRSEVKKQGRFKSLIWFRAEFRYERFSTTSSELCSFNLKFWAGGRAGEPPLPRHDGVQGGRSGISYVLGGAAVGDGTNCVDFWLPHPVMTSERPELLSRRPSGHHGRVTHAALTAAPPTPGSYFHSATQTGEGVSGLCPTIASGGGGRLLVCTAVPDETPRPYAIGSHTQTPLRSQPTATRRARNRRGRAVVAVH